MGDGNTMSEYRNKKAMGILNWILGGCKTAKDIMEINKYLKIGELYFAHRFDMDKDKELGIINRIYEAPIPPFGIIEIYNPLANEIELENKYGSAYYETTELEKQHHFANEIVQLDLVRSTIRISCSVFGTQPTTDRHLMRCFTHLRNVI